MTIEMEQEATQCAHHVLGYHHDPRGYQPGGFTTSLLDTWSRADHQNAARLASAFPVLGAVINVLRDRGLDDVAIIINHPQAFLLNNGFGH